MTTDSLHYKTTSQLITDGAWWVEKNHLSAHKWKALCDRLNEQKLPQELVLPLVAILSIRTCVDLPDQEAGQLVDILAKNEGYSIPLNPVTEANGAGHSFLKHCNGLHHSMAANAGKAATSFASKFLIVVHDDHADLTIPEVTQGVLVVIRIAEAVQIDWYGNREILSEGRVKLLAETQDRLLNWLLKEDWAQPLPDLLNEQERTVRNKVNETLTAIKPQLIHQAFFHHAVKHPQDIALYWENGQSNKMSYGELANTALKLSRVLVNNVAEPGSRVAIVLPKGAPQLIAVMGILGSGAVYVPIGVDQPAGRQEKIFKTAGAKCIVTDSSTLLNYPHLKEIALVQQIALLNLDEMSTETPLDAPVHSNVDQLAYIIFTSGSTGEPKGVEITHAAAWNTIQDINAKFGISASDRALAISALDFDLSVYDIFGLLAVGGSLVLIREEGRKEASRWLYLVEKYEVTVWNSVPALFDMLLLSADAENDLHSLRLVLLSGDWVGLDLKDRMKERTGDCELIALGGATEASIWSNYFPVNEVDQNWRSIPYGKPLANQQYRVVNYMGMDCPDGVTGELWIGGKGVAAGYTNNEALTNSRFVTANGERWYRTGDLGRYWPNGILEFLGRIDHQVKVNGFRIELGEIEAALKTFPGVAQATAAVLTINQSRHLVAGVVAEKALSADVPDDDLPVAVPSDAAKKEYELQKQVVAAFLYELLDLSKYAREHAVNDAQLKQLRAQLIAALQIAPEYTTVLDMWLHWLREQNKLTANNGQPAFTAIAKPSENGNSFLNTFSGQLHERKPLFRQILSNVVPAVALLDDELLSPEILSTHDKGILKGIERIVEKINEAATRSEKTLKVAILGGRTGLLTEKLLQAVAGNKIAYSVIDEGRAMVRSFTERLSEAGYQVNGIELKHNQVPEEYWYYFDFVVAINTLHRFPEPDQGVFISNLLLNNGGRLLAIEAALLMPVALLSSGVIDRGFQHFDPQRRETYSPMLDKHAWKSYFLKTGFVKVYAEDIPGSSTILYDTCCSEKRHHLKESSILAHIQALLPLHMIPEKLAVLPRMPLSANGKVDRKSFTELIRTMVEAAVRKKTEDFEMPAGDMENGIAAIWKELLALDAIGRNDVFFEIGGDSLSATRFLTEVKKRYDVHLSLRELFGATLKDVADKVQTQHLQLQQELETMETGEI